MWRLQARVPPSRGQKTTLGLARQVGKGIEQSGAGSAVERAPQPQARGSGHESYLADPRPTAACRARMRVELRARASRISIRSEERRVGQEGRYGGAGSGEKTKNRGTSEDPKEDNR